MAVTSGVVSVGTTATLLSGPDTDTTFGQTLYVTNSSDVIVYLGSGDVTGETDGYPLAAGDSFPWPMMLGGGEAVYGIVATGTADVAVFRLGV